MGTCSRMESGARFILLLCCAILVRAVAPPPTVTLRNGVKMPFISAGSGAYTANQTALSFASALAVGFTALDTAHEYGNQQGAAQALASANRKQVFLETKVPGCGVP